MKRHLLILKKFRLFGVQYAITDYEHAANTIVDRAQEHRSYGVSALAVHGLVTSQTTALKNRINELSMIVPDGQPIRWALNTFFKAGLSDRVYGPSLTLHVLALAEKKDLNIFLYGSTNDTLTKMHKNLLLQFPKLKICGVHVDRFRDATPDEDQGDIDKIIQSQAHIVLVGRGCPRQEQWVLDHQRKIPAALLAVGAAFDFIAGTKAQAPHFLQKLGLEWLFRLISEPRRLWKRYLVTNSIFMYWCLRKAWTLRR